MSMLLDRRSAAFFRLQMTTAARRLKTAWLAELFELLPHALARHMRGNRNAARLRIDETDVYLDILDTRGALIQNIRIPQVDFSPHMIDHHISELGLRPSQTEIALLLPPAAFFIRTFALPRRAQGQLTTIARREIEHRTPFRLDDIYFGTETEHQTDDVSTLTVRQTIVRRRFVDSVIDRLGLTPGIVRFVLMDGCASETSAARVALVSTGEQPNTASHKVLRPLIAAIIILACMDAALFWWQQETKIAKIEASAQVARQAAIKVETMRQSIQRFGKSLAALETRRRQPTVADLWQETSRVLPDNSWLTEWRLHGAELSTVGFSTAATRLVGVFEQSPLFGDTNFNAPITSDAGTAKERFSLISKVRTRSPMLAH